MVAVKGYRHEAAQWRLNHGADTAMKDDDGRDAFVFARENRDPTMLKPNSPLSIAPEVSFARNQVRTVQH
jgi:hypothetical protein